MDLETRLCRLTADHYPPTLSYTHDPETLAIGESTAPKATLETRFALRPGTTLGYYFMNPDGNRDDKEEVKKAFNIWQDTGIDLYFKEVETAETAQIRISFTNNGSWSYVGTQYTSVPHDKATMNFGWSLTTNYGKRTALHEIGHAIGLIHEHQNPSSGIKWNKQKVYEYFRGPPNEWNDEDIEVNILKQYSPWDVKGTIWDKDSVMHYEFKEGLILEPEIYKTKPLTPNGYGLSDQDIHLIRTVYPPKNDKPESLVLGCPLMFAMIGVHEYAIEENINASEVEVVCLGTWTGNINVSCAQNNNWVLVQHELKKNNNKTTVTISLKENCRYKLCVNVESISSVVSVLIYY